MKSIAKLLLALSVLSLGGQTATKTVAQFAYWVGNSSPASFDLGMYVINQAGASTTLSCHVSTGTITPNNGWNFASAPTGSAACPAIPIESQIGLGYITSNNTLQQGATGQPCQYTLTQASTWAPQISATALPNPFPSTGTTEAIGAHGCYSMYVVFTDGSTAGVTTQATTDSGDQNYPLSTPAIVPANFACAVGGSCQIVLSWQAPAGSTGGTYNVYRGTGLNGPWTQIQTNVIPTTFTDSTIVPGTGYFYYVTYVLSGSESTPSNTVAMLVPPPAQTQTPPTAPTLSVTVSAPASN